MPTPVHNIEDSPPPRPRRTSQPGVFDDPEHNKTLRTICEGAVAHKWITQEECDKFVAFLRENIMTEERIMREYNSGRAAGVEGEFARITKQLQNMAGQLFILNKDEEARRMRDLVAKLKNE